MTSQFMVTPELLNGMIGNVSYTVIGESTTICNIVLKNGFSVIGEEHCVDPANFNKKKGEEYAYEKAFNNLWPLAGFLMKQRMHESGNLADRIAKVCYEAYRAYCVGIGDYNHKSWEETEELHREAARQSANACLQQDLTPEEQHNLWMRHKQTSGWKYGERLDVAAKTHPCIVPYSMLPEKQKIKDLLFGAVVNAMRS